LPPEKIHDGNASRSHSPPNHGGVTLSRRCQKSLTPAQEPSEVTPITNSEEDRHAKDSESTDGENITFLERSAPVVPQEEVSLVQESSASVSIEVIPDEFEPGDFIKVAARTSSGMNKPGCVGAVNKIDPEKRYLDVKYTLGGMDLQRRSPKKGRGGKPEHPRPRPAAGKHKRSAPQEGSRFHQRSPKRYKTETKRAGQKAAAATQKPKGWTGYALVEEGEHKPCLLTGGLFEPQILTTERVSLVRHVITVVRMLVNTIS
jgi:hypothetical protein